MPTKIYYIHDNGGRPFKVVIKNREVLVYKQLFDADINYDNKPLMRFIPTKIFIGKSPINRMTKFSLGYGDDFDGNSILLNLSDNKYVYIGSDIRSFKTRNRIIKYVSPVGNNDVPYPYAIDSKGNIYLIVEGIILKNSRQLKSRMKDYDDPYSYYYDWHLITSDIGSIPPKIPKLTNHLKISEFFLGNDPYTLTFDPNPDKEYDRLIQDFGSDIYVIDEDGNRIDLDRNTFIDLMNKFNRKLQVKRLSTKILQKRLI